MSSPDKRTSSTYVSKKESGTKSGGTSQLLPKSTEKKYLMSQKPQPQ